MSYSPISFNPQGTGTAEGLVTNYTNASVTTAIAQGQACTVNSAGLISPLDITSQASWQGFVGYANVRIPASALGPVAANGRLQNITTSFALGAPLYIGLDGNPTNIIPSTDNGFPSGAAVIFLGVLVSNETIPSEIDIALFTQVIGVL